MWTHPPSVGKSKKDNSGGTNKKKVGWGVGGDELELNYFILFRRRLPVMMVKNHMAQTLKAATTFIEQGRILWFNIVLIDEKLD